MCYGTHKGFLKAVDEVSLEIQKRHIYALVGESGCGKSTLGLALSRLLPEKNVRYSGKVILDGVNIISIKEREAENYRGTQIATIFQEPMTSLNPTQKIGEQIGEALWIRYGKSDGRAPARPEDKRTRPKFAGGLGSVEIRHRFYHEYVDEIIGLLAKVQIPNARGVADLYPHELSGGMRQRVMITMALAERPSFLVADEPTTALDVTTQTQILELIISLSEELDMGVLLITHDLGVVAAVADVAGVMYAGKIVEEAPVAELFGNPLHPYTCGLMASFPRGRKDNFLLKTIHGSVPPLGQYPSGCSFHPRCPKAFGACQTKLPPLIHQSTEHKVACLLYGEVN